MKRSPCCGYLTIDDSCQIITDICDVCFWQFDELAQNEPDRIVGANAVSLNTARKNFKMFGAVEERFKEMVRLPYNDELRDEMSRSFAAGIFDRRKAEYLKKISCPSEQALYWDTTF